MPPRPIFDLSQIDLDTPLYDLEEIRKVNPQRDAMEQLTAVVWVDQEQSGLVGYKDVTDQEFWISGHMPDYPLMPGVILCECAAQLAGFYARKFDLLGGDYLGFGGMNAVRFRKPVFPNCRLVLAAQVTRVRKGKRAEYQFQGFVDGDMVFSGEMIGVAISKDSSG